MLVHGWDVWLAGLVWGVVFAGDSSGAVWDWVAEMWVGYCDWQIALQHPGEYLVQVKGSVHSFDGHLIIESLEFVTNRRSYGPYGALKPQGLVRSTQRNGKIVGFFGRSAWYVDQLGVVVSVPSKKEDALICQGPWGGAGGIPFTDGRGEISELVVRFSKTQVISVVVTYEVSGSKYSSQPHGGADGGETKKVRILCMGTVGIRMAWLCLAVGRMVSGIAF